MGTVYFSETLVSTYKSTRRQYPEQHRHLKNSVRTAKKTPHFTITKINWLTLFKEIIAVYSENHTKHINTTWGQNAELLNVKSGGTYSYHCALKG
jgi:uracil DNA glycosylase